MSLLSKGVRAHGRWEGGSRQARKQAHRRGLLSPLTITCLATMSESSDPASSNTPLAPALHSPPLPAPPPPHPTSPFQIPLPPSPTTVVRPLVYPRQSTERASHAKRGSIAFPTIDHLQHHFTKISIAGNKHEEGPRTPPPFDVSSSSSTSTSTGPSSFAPHLRPLSYRDLPPSPAQPRPQSKPAFPPSSTTPVTALKPEAVRHIQTMEHIFRLGVQEEDDGSGELMEELGEPVDLRELLKAAITTVRAVRSFVMALPDEAVPSPALPSPSVTPSPSPSPVSTPPPSSFLPHQHFSVPSRPSTLSSGGRPASFGSRSVSGPTSRPNPLIQSTRKLALDLLGILRLAEERHRLPVSHSQQASVSSSSSQPSSPPLITPTPLPLGWKEAQHASEEAKLSWEDRLASYDPDVTLSKLNKEREAARSYLDEIDVLLFGGRVGRTRGWCISRGDAASGLGRRRSFTPQTVSEYSMISETTDGGEREEDGGEEEDWLDHSKPLASEHDLILYSFVSVRDS
jgi:hypothetical protein